jgi:flagellin
MTIDFNSSAQKAAMASGNAYEGLTSALERISTGKQINRASDDAAGMRIASSLRSRALAMGQGIANASDGMSIAQVADGALGEMRTILESVRTNVVAAANGSQSQKSLTAIQKDISGALEALDDVAGATTYNGQMLLDGSFSDRQFVLGENSVISLSVPAADTRVLGSSESSLAQIDVTTADGAQTALDAVDQALSQVSQARSQVGSSQNQFASSIENLTTTRLNTLAAESTIMDVDLAEESMVLSQMKTLEKAGLFALSQANKIHKENLANLLG